VTTKARCYGGGLTVFMPKTHSLQRALSHDGVCDAKLFAIVAALSVLASAAHAADGCAIVASGARARGDLSMRAEPMTRSHIVGRLVPGDFVYISSATCETEGTRSICDTSWTKIDAVWRLDGNNFSKPWRLHRGWVPINSLRFVEDCDAAERQLIKR
jgi:hypothetical protein